MSSRATNGKQFLALRVLLTEDCNLACVFCHNEGQAGLAMRSALDVGTFRLLINAAVGRNLRQIKFSGGEPTLHPDLTDLVRISTDLGLDTAVISNGLDLETLRKQTLLGARTCLNIPSANPDTYHGLTGGRLGTVICTLASLRDAGSNVSINSYAGLAPNLRQITGLLTLATAYSCDLKLLLPCQVISAESQQRSRVAYGRMLQALGCRHTLDTPYDSRWRTHEGSSVRVVQPWCPRACKAVAGYYKSLRLAANMRLLPCFDGSALSVPVDFTCEDSCGRSLDTALALTATGCGDVAGVKVLRRTIGRANGERRAH